MIIYISENLNNKKNGGSSTSGYEFLQFLRIKHKRVIVLTVDNINFPTQEETFYGYDVQKVERVVSLKRTYQIKPFNAKKIAKKIYYFFKDFFKESVCDLNQFYEENGSENIIYVNSWSGIFDRKKLQNIERFKKVCVVRGSPESFIWQSFEKNKNHAIQKAANFLELFDSLIFVSQNGLEAWNKILKKPIDSYYLPNSINERDISESSRVPIEIAKEQLNIKSNDYNIVVVGSVQKRKAQDILLEIVERVIHVIPNIKFHIVGGISDTWGGDKIYKEIINSRFSEYFIFHGHSNKQILFMRASDICLFTSRAEAFPRTVAEYMAIGKPIIASDVSGVNEMIKDGVNGVLYTNDKLEKAVKAIINLHADNNYANKLAKRAQDDYFEKFSKKIHISKAMVVFEQMISS